MLGFLLKMGLRLLCWLLLFSATLLSWAARPGGGAEGEAIDLHKNKCGGQVPASNQTSLDVFPTSEVRYEAFNGTRRKLGDFRECAPCTCCTDETRKFCFLTGCCYNINCSLRRVPFGLCSFTPMSCSCFGCS